MSDQPAEDAKRQFVKFTFYQVESQWRRIAPEERALGRRQLCDVVDAFGDRMLIGSYSLTGLRGDTDFMLWQIADELEEFQALATQVFSTALGPYLTVPYSYLAMTRRSIYKTRREPAEDGQDRLRVQPGDAKYLFVYPFVKTRPWYDLSKDVRQGMMNDHIGIGRKYPSVKLNTTYSYGLDDQEFVVSFETNSPADFLDLVMELRETKSSMYTLRDTPTFTCVSMALPEVLDMLGAPGDIELAGGTPEAAADGWAPVAQLADIPSGGAKVVYYRSDQVALFNIDGKVYAIANRCSHANGPLAEGRLEGCVVTCPWHDSQFDVTTGQQQHLPAQAPVTTYQTKVEDGAVLLAGRGVHVEQP